jgi:hypothetical protein
MILWALVISKRGLFVWPLFLELVIAEIGRGNQRNGELESRARQWNASRLITALFSNTH